MIFSIGHSNHDEAHFCELLSRHAIDVLVDVRTSPYSRYATQFNRETLAETVRRLGIRYLPMGDQLGGRPEGKQFYDDEGYVLYHRLAEARFFLAGIERLRQGSNQYRLAMMCSEEDPSVCHRFLLISRVLSSRGEEVLHIRGDGSLQGDDEIRATSADLSQGLLFRELEQDAWKSLRSVLPKAPPPISSDD